MSARASRRRRHLPCACHDEKVVGPYQPVALSSHSNGPQGCPGEKSLPCHLERFEVVHC